MNEKQNRHIIDILFVIALFAIFVLSAVFLISIGAKIYSKTMSNMENNFNSRTAVAYITEKIHQSDENGNVSLGKFEGSDAIVIDSVMAGKEYVTYIYLHEGQIKELTLRKDIILSQSAGSPIIAVDDFTMEMVSDSLASFNITISNDESYHFYVNIYSEAKEVADEF